MIVWRPKKPDGVVPRIGISLNGEEPWNRLSWNYQHGQIPVPEMKGMYSECVRGIYEGLKLVGPEGKSGKINPGYFTGPGRPRTVKEKEWMLGWSIKGVRCGAVEANGLILVPTYTWVLDNKVYDVVAKLKTIAARHEEEGNNLYLYDDVSNGHQLETSAVSPASILVEYINDTAAPSYQ